MLIKSLAPIGFSNYAVDDAGVVWRLKGTLDRRGSKVEKDYPLRPGVDARGYMHVRMTPDRGFFRRDPQNPGMDPDRVRLRKIHRLVAWAFLPGYKEWSPQTRRECNTVDHVDGDKTNNRAENLRIVTLAENGRAYRRLRREGYRPALPDSLSYALTVSVDAAEIVDRMAELGEQHGKRAASRTVLEILKAYKEQDRIPGPRPMPAADRLITKTWLLSREVMAWIRQKYKTTKMRMGVFVNAAILEVWDQVNG